MRIALSLVLPSGSTVGAIVSHFILEMQLAPEGFFGS
jgi:hypothetical protein